MTQQPKTYNINTMNKIKELTDLIANHQPQADAGHTGSKQIVMNAQMQLDEIESNAKAQMVLISLFAC